MDPQKADAAAGVESLVDRIAGLSGDDAYADWLDDLLAMAEEAVERGEATPYLEGRLARIQRHVRTGGQSWAPSSSAGVRASMQGNVSEGTGPERALWAELESRGWLFDKNAKGLPGRPDVTFRHKRVAVFVNGCFWHRCPDCCPKPPGGRNSRFWAEKFAMNAERQAQAVRDLEGGGWIVAVIWECWVKADVKLCADIVGAALGKEAAGGG